MSKVIFTEYEVSRCADGNMMAAKGTVDGVEFSCDENSYDGLSVLPTNLHRQVSSALMNAQLPRAFLGRDHLAIEKPVIVDVAG